MTVTRNALGNRLLLFVVLSFGISWALWFSAALLPGDAGGASALDGLATFGPAVAAVVLSRRGGHSPSPSVGRRQLRRRAIRVLLPLLVLGVSILVLAPRWTAAATPLAATLLAVLTLLPATLVRLATSGDAGWRELLGSLISPRSPWWTFVVAVMAFPVMSVVGSLLIAVLGGDVGRPPQIVRDDWSSVLLVFAATLLYGGPLGEEVGWRGWAVPTLQKRFSPLLTSLFVGLLWGFWHLPLHLRGVYDDAMGAGVPGLALRIASSCLLAVLFTWLYNRSRGGLLVVVLLHTSVNNTAGYWLPVNIGLTVVLLVAASVLIVTDRMWQRPGMPQPAEAASSG